MKKINLLLILVFSGFFSLAQDTLFVEDFNNNRNQWPIITNANNHRKIKNGVYIFENRLKKGSFESRVAVLIPEKFDYEVNLVFTKTKGPNERANGLIFGSNGKERFSFVISGNGKFSIDKYEKGQWHDFYPWTATSYIKTKGSNHLKMRKAGDYYLFYINGKQVGQIKYQQPFGNQVGITVSRETTVEIDKIWILKHKAQPFIPVKIFAETNDSTKVSSISKGEKIIEAKEIAEFRARIEMYSKYLKYHPQSTEAMLNRASVYMQIKEYINAISDYNSLLKFQSNNVVYLEKRALAYQALKQNEKAIADVERIVLLHPSDVNKRIMLIALYVDNKDYDDALSEINASIQIYPQNADLHNLQGEIYVLKENQNAAINSFETALKFAPEHKKAKLNLERIKNRLFTENQQINAFSELIKKMPLNPDNYYYRAVEREKILDLDGAMDDYSQAINLSYSNVDVYLARAGLYEKKAQYDKAVADYSKYIEKFPWNPTVIEKRANLYQKLGNTSMALTDFTSAIKFEPNKTALYQGRVEIYKNAKQYDKALVDYKKIMDLDEKNSNAAFNYGKILIEVKNNKTEGCKFVQKAVAAGNKEAKEYETINCKSEKSKGNK